MDKAENDIIKEEKEVINPEVAKKALKKINKNPWMFASIALSVLLIVSLVVIFDEGVSKSTAGQIILDFANTQTGGGVELVDVEEVSGLYEVNVLYQGQEIPLYLTKDGKTLVQGIMALEEIETPTQQQSAVTTEPVKSDRPQVDLFIWGYCPYGVQAQGPLAEVALLLQDYADFRAVMYYDGHGAFETQQNKIQTCIQKLYSDKYWEYATGFTTEVYPICSQSRDAECDKTMSISVMDEVGIDSDKVMKCVEDEGADLIAIDSAYAQASGVTGSPTLMINGVITSSARTAEAYKTAVCAAFNEAPEACGETLSADAAASSGSC